MIPGIIIYATGLLYIVGDKKAQPGKRENAATRARRTLLLDRP